MHGQELRLDIFLFLLSDRRARLFLNCCFKQLDSTFSVRERERERVLESAAALSRPALWLLMPVCYMRLLLLLLLSPSLWLLNMLLSREVVEPNDQSRYRKPECGTKLQRIPGKEEKERERHQTQEEERSGSFATERWRKFGEVDAVEDEELLEEEEEEASRVGDGKKERLRQDRADHGQQLGTATARNEERRNVSTNSSR